MCLGSYLISVSLQRESVATVHGALAEMPPGRWLLAVSGGRDSMVLLDAMASARPGELAGVATFDHGTGAAARRACALVELEAERRQIPVVSGSAPAGLPVTEAAWRDARHRFLGAWAAELDAVVVTGHTRDDQIETLVQRLLRDAGPRGLAGMLVPAAHTPARPFLRVPRAVLADFAAARSVPFVEDPSNASLTFQRNRVRHEILPALERASPGFAEWCWALGVRAAAWREEMEALVDSIGATIPDAGTLVLPASHVGLLGPREWAVLWPALAARVGVVMDRRGTERAAEWAPRAAAGQAIPLSGDAGIERTRSTFVIRGTTTGLRDYILHQ